MITQVLDGCKIFNREVDVHAEQFRQTNQGPIAKILGRWYSVNGTEGLITEIRFEIRADDFSAWGISDAPNESFYKLAQKCTKHTPGPWHIIDAAPSLTIRSADQFVVGFPHAEDRQRADAKLIKSAPDLLADLKWAAAQLTALRDSVANGSRASFFAGLEQIAKTIDSAEIR